MASREETIRVLDEVLKVEKMAEQNCEAVLKEMRINGFHELIEKIRNDEHRHQKVVQQLIEILKK